MNLLNEAQTEQLKEISQYLLRVRQEKSIRIEEVAAKTHIQKNCLQALETGHFEELPEPVYVQGFIRRYADALGLDGTALANTFTINVVPPYTNTSPNNSQNLDKRAKIHIPLFIPYALLLIIAAIGLIYILNPRLIVDFVTKQQNSIATSTQKTAPSSESSLSELESQTQQQNSIPTPRQITAPSPESPLALEPFISTTNQNVEVTLELQGKSWLRVQVDGKTEFVGELTKGERRTWTAKEQLIIRSGNAGAVLISVNNQPAIPFGDAGAIKEVTFTPEVNN
ncbi:helix-turn-helix domain-containing protein [Nostocaceae cyanobacterium CENA357]|uniref:Helix-turn-helix domain-containing protein n=1 Tax=Atlanticothrix silvestris CENA357 TaxID=1725252 RepID=A0A8J7HFM7_9CYAN|nr:RodZ family helix-turn-helix domain-containing protein [Atlanticothrix silvestris]MBH8554204.1 helix-turn-helix domain-containing protein [Atlanticothrix silvestris CENA357]